MARGMRYGALALVLALAVVVGCAAGKDHRRADAGGDDTGDDTGEPPIPPVDRDPPSDDENRYHWDGVADPYFEGWYYKVNDAASGLAFFFIYSVIFPGNPATGEGSVYVGGGPDGLTTYVPFPASDFHASRDHCEVYVASVRNAATEARIQGDAAADGHAWRWDLSIAPEVSWDQTMGWLTNQPGLDVNWHVAHLRARATGFVEADGVRHDLADALLFADHNWGPAFPAYWMWLQGADFAGRSDAIAVAGGVVAGPWGTMDAYQIGYWRDGVLHTFRTQDRAVITGTYSGLAWWIDAVQDQERVTIAGTTDPPGVLTLLVPTADGMRPGAGESLTGAISVSFWRDEGGTWTEVDNRVTGRAGVEAGGTWR